MADIHAWPAVVVQFDGLYGGRAVFSSNSKLQFLGAKRADFVGFATKTSLF